jgi:nicotinamide-nucleotide amidase
MTPQTDLPALSELAASASRLLIERSQTVAVAESASGGLISASLLAVPGASKYFLGGGVIYTRRAARALLGLTADDAVGMRGETEPYAALIAEKIRMNLGATWGISESGAAGPKGSPYGDAPGHACLAIAGAVSKTWTIDTGIDDRSENMSLFARRLLYGFVEILRFQ